jgi:hypothetical protein
MARIPQVVHDTIDWQKLKVLAFDPSTSKIGWCVGLGNTYLTSGTINLTKLAKWAGLEGDAWVRLGILPGWASLLFLVHEPDVCAIEYPRPFRRNPETDRKMGGSVAALHVAAWQTNTPRILHIQPDDVRRTLYHKKAQRHTAKAFGIPLDEMTPDRADAIGCWWHAKGVLRGEYQESDANAERWRKLVEEV